MEEEASSLSSLSLRRLQYHVVMLSCDKLKHSLAPRHKLKDQMNRKGSSVVVSRVRQTAAVFTLFTSCDHFILTHPVISCLIEPETQTLFKTSIISLLIILCPPSALHPDHHTDYLHEPQRIRGPRYALHAQSLRHHLPPGAQCPEEEAFLQSRRHGRHYVIPTVPQDERQTQRGGQDGAV